MSAATASERLLLAAQYAMDASDEVEAAAEARDPYARTGYRQLLKAKLEAARDLLADLERDDPGVTTPYTFEGGSEVTMTVPIARVWLYRVEAEVMMRCYEDWEGARQLVERAIAIKSDNAHDHFLLACIHAERRDFEEASTAIERAISLEPDNFDFKRARNNLKHDMSRWEVDAKVATPFSIWRPSTWFS